MCGANPHRIKRPGHYRISRSCGIPCRINKMLARLVLTRILKELESVAQETAK
nr:MAG TPA: hypothetical protein [Bacteriophage sp.]